MNNEHTIFVYGTLKKGCYNHNRWLGPWSLMIHGDFKGYLTLTGYALHTGQYPCMVRTNDALDKVRGELYTISDLGKKALDMLERDYEYTQVKPGVYAYVGPEDFPKGSLMPRNKDGVFEWTPEYELQMNNYSAAVRRAQGASRAA